MTKVGVFVELDWQYDMYFKFFTELFPDAEIRKHQDIETIIIAKEQRIHIYRKKPTVRGMKFDVVITLINDDEYNSILTIPSLNCSKYFEEGWGRRSEG